MIELNVNPIGPDGQPVQNPIITLYVLDAKLHECPMEPRIRPQTNFYAAAIPFSQATGTTGPYKLYGTAVAAGFQTTYIPYTDWDGNSTINLTVPLIALPFNPPVDWTIDQLCAVRGGMWTARLDIPYGPRPDLPSNINALDYLESFDAPTRARMLASYGRDGNRYTHCPDGPLLDEGYHGKYPAVDFRANPSAWFGFMREKWAAGICPVHFAYPDLYGFASDAFDNFVRDFEPIYRSPEAQELIKVWVPYGWERGYEVTSAMWVRMLQWAHDVLPNALIALHLVADQDAPTGGNDYLIPGWSNGKAWQAVAPYTHLWFVQNAGYVNGPGPVPTPEFVRNFTEQFNPMVRGSLAFRFASGYADWPTNSAFGPGIPIKLVAGEFASFQDFWSNWPESEAQKLGDGAIQSGAVGSFDGCNLAI